MFKHFIITEFNIKLETAIFATDKKKQPVLTHDWMVNRFKLFETYYLPSLAQQTCRNFTCLIYFDTDTEQEFKDRLAVLQKQYPFFRCFYVPGYSELKKQINDDVRALCSADTQYVLTTHMDNDDALHRLAVEKIQKAFRPRHEYGINLCKGYRFFAGPERAVLLKNSFINGPFCSFIEEIGRTEKIRTMNVLSHHTFFDNYKVKQIRDGYYWLQSIHKANLVNELTGIPTLKTSILRDFALDDTKVQLARDVYMEYLVKFFTNIKNFIPFYAKYIVIRKILKRYSTKC